MESSGRPVVKSAWLTPDPHKTIPYRGIIEASDCRGCLVGGEPEIVLQSSKTGTEVVMRLDRIDKTSEGDVMGWRYWALVMGIGPVEVIIIND